MIVAPGSTSVSVEIHMVDAVTGADKTDIPTSQAAGLLLQTRLTPTSALLPIQQGSLAALTDAWANGGRIHVAAGSYRCDLPDSAIPATVGAVTRIYASAAGAVQTGGPLELVGESRQSVVSAAEVSAQRTWLFAKHGRDHHAENTLVINASASNVLTLAFDCTSLLNPDTSLASVSSVTLTPADTGPAITATSLAIDTSQRKAMFRVTGFTTADTYTVTATVATNDSQTLVIKGVLRVVS